MPLVLNWLEIEKAVALANAGLAGHYIDQWIVPERSRFPGGFVKGEWLLRTSGRKQEGAFLFSVRPRHPYFAFRERKGPRAAVTGTRSPFDLAVAKQLKGRRVHSLQALKRERMIVLWLETGQPDKLGLLLSLIPATPEALLIEGSPSVTQGWRVLARSRVNRQQEAAPPNLFVPPDGSKAPPSPPVRSELLTSCEVLWSAIDADLEKEAFALRLERVRRELRVMLSKTDERLNQSKEAIVRGEGEPDWQRYGDILKTVLHSPPACDERGVRRVEDHAAGGALVELPCDPRLSPAEQVAKFYSLAKRRKRRIAEGQARRDRFAELRLRFEAELQKEVQELDWSTLEKLEQLAGFEPAPVERPRAPKRTGWLGRSFRSKEGLPIFVGKSSAENLELTFKVARGNDIWMHVRGRPGAHVLIPLPPGKSAALETLLDAAVLAVYYSGGEKWGKTEVDYTFKKHVRRIKGSTEASYTHNKTLIVEPEPARLKRLLGAASGDSSGVNQR